MVPRSLQQFVFIRESTSTLVERGVGLPNVTPPISSILVSKLLYFLMINKRSVDMQHIAPPHPCGCGGTFFSNIIFQDMQQFPIILLNHDGFFNFHEVPFLVILSNVKETHASSLKGHTSTNL
jgi:hypothetical protein